MNNYKIWIARDESQISEDGYKIPGNLTAFYDTPQLEYNLDSRTWCYTKARILSKLPSYMYPNVKEKECLVFNSICEDEDLKEKYRDAASEVINMALDGKFGYESDIKYINKFDELVK